MSRVPTMVVVDDSADVRRLLRLHVGLSRRFTVVGEGADGLEAIELAERLRPDLMLLDVSMPRVDGLQALVGVRRTAPDTVVVMYSGFDEEGLAARARELGAAAYLQKSGSLEGLVDELAEIHRSVAPQRSVPEAPAPGEAEEVEEIEEDSPVLAEHVERFREIFDDAAIGMATLTLSGRIVRANPSLTAILGRDGLVGLDYADAMEQPTHDLGAVLSRILSGEEDAVQVEHGVPGRPELLVQATITPVRDSARRPQYLFLQAQDVSRQRGAETELLRSEQRFRMLVEAVQDYAIFMLDPEGRIASWNIGAQRSKGYTAEEIIGQHFRVFYPRHVQESGHPERELEIALREGRYSEEGWRIRRDGSQFWAHVTITAVHDEQGRHIGFGKVTRDTTERLLAAEALEEANRTLQAAADAQAQFLASTAHELRGPVGILAMSADTLQRHWHQLDDEERTDFLDGMSRSASQLNRLLNDLLTAERLHHSALKLDPEPMAVRPQLRLLAATLRKAHPQAEVILAGDEDAVVIADPGRFTQAMDNLLTNAIRHGRPPVRVEVRRRGDRVDLRVSDDGPGVPEEIRPRLFERFATGSRRGTGLGLHIVRELARAQGGDATYDAERATFVLTLPAAPVSADENG